jgi:RNA-binding protein 39
MLHILCIGSLTGGMGTTSLNTPVGIPAVSVLGAAPATAPVLHPTVPGLGSIPGATLPISTPSIELAPPSECLLLKNMFDPAVEVRMIFLQTGGLLMPHQ